MISKKKKKRERAHGHGLQGGDCGGGGRMGGGGRGHRIKSVGKNK